ncbi:MAG: polysaccharide deacetylase family protein [Rhodospirillales bacterium]|nr:polysaccharide deacetylase family protein [Rhodospirillales bacterium]
MAQWRDLNIELDAWSDCGRTASLWWRDDDACEATPALEKLLSISDLTGTPIALAVIPEGSGAGLRQRLAGQKHISVLQHGFAHVNHAPVGHKKAEFGPHRTIEIMESDLAGGKDLLSDFEYTFPAFVPPWNNIDESLLARLSGIGLKAVSTYLPRNSSEPVPGLRRTNAHVDIINWRGNRGFIGDESALEMITGHLRSRRIGGVDPEEPTGLLTHHLVHDEACWRFIEDLLQNTISHDAVRWIGAEEAFLQ